MKKHRPRSEPAPCVVVLTVPAGLKFEFSLDRFKVGRVVVAGSVYLLGDGNAGEFSVNLVLDDRLKRICVLIIWIEPRAIGFRSQDNRHPVVNRLDGRKAALVSMVQDRYCVVALPL